MRPGWGMDTRKPVAGFFYHFLLSYYVDSFDKEPLL